jgi:hypothetical protein
MTTNNADKFTSSYGTRTMTQCATCAHWSRDNAKVCAAYPQGIPLIIVTNEVSHKKPLPNDNGIQWTAKA